MNKHSGETDKVQKTKLTSSIEQVLWSKNYASPGAKIGLEVFTQFAGNNSDIQIEITDKSGKKFETIKKKFFGNKFWAEITVPEKARDELFAEVKLPKHNINKKSNSLYLFPLIKITNVKWDKNEARRGDVLKLSAGIEGVADGTESEIQIWEHDSDGAHDLITKIPAIVKNKKIETDWEYEYHEDTDEIPTEEETEKGYNPPEYFFRVNIAGVSADSGLLEFKDWIEIEVIGKDGEALKDKEYILTMPDGSEKRGKLNEEGKAKVEDIPPGSVKITIEETEN
jgi:hypothetical protein